MRATLTARLGALVGFGRGYAVRVDWRRWGAGFAVAGAGLPVVTGMLAAVRTELSLVGDVLVYLFAVAAVSVIGGRLPALLTSGAGFLLLAYYFAPPIHSFAVADPGNVLLLLAYLVAGALLDALIERVIRRSRDVVEMDGAPDVDRARSALLTAMGHDLRTPLAAALAAVDGLAGTDVHPSEDQRRDLLDVASVSLRKLDGLVENLMELSKLRAGMLPIAARPVEVVDMVESTIADLGPAAVAVQTRVAAALPPVVVDPALLDRALNHLLRNALRFAPGDSGVLVTANACGDAVQIRVIDHGPGIPMAQRERVFQPFQRFDDRDNRSGIGLGLALARGLVEAMGGRLVPDDTPGGGLTMIVTLPVAAASRASAAYW
ncbi:PAS domain-containing sensor histidine kinase [Nocardia sp. CDC159]|uniref:histidine kinase n=1 Tax=Nocardia pulmonis TaxID=2951408 RepID=A0A9X2EE57_9NOCA|nr:MULTISPECIES: ATP-binding protein [Nocardia]MCM6776476.1 PAS domain-containing sensor histidine kinase [Nocardia pulmonis]MCM6788900.1 PAS domain-containing sensor histidine kinase [Nocardia sp. CDC159]